MRLVDPRPVSLPSAVIQMEDRKRPAGHALEEGSPPLKKQVVNGVKMAHPDADMPWRDDLEVSRRWSIFLPLLH